MTNKNIIKICLGILGNTLFIFVFYLIFIKPHIIGTYMPTIKDCKNAYNCTCLKDNCICTYSKWFIENKTVCAKENLEKEQINK